MTIRCQNCNAPVVRLKKASPWLHIDRGRYAVDNYETGCDKPVPRYIKLSHYQIRSSQQQAGEERNDAHT